MHRPTSKQQRTFANIRLWKHCFPAYHNFFKYGSESSTGAKVKGHESCLWSERSTVAIVLGTFASEERKFQGCESSMERKFLDFSLPGSECSTERKFHGSESFLWTIRSRERKCRGTKRPDAYL